MRLFFTQRRLKQREHPTGILKTLNNWIRNTTKEDHWLKLLSSELSAMKSTSSLLRRDFTAAKDKYEELTLKYDALMQRQELEL